MQEILYVCAECEEIIKGKVIIMSIDWGSGSFPFCEECYKENKN